MLRGQALLFKAAAACCACSQPHYSYRARHCFRSQQLHRENASQAAPHSSSPSSPITSTGPGPAAHLVQALCCWGQWANKMPDSSGSDLSKIWRLLYSLEDSLAFTASRRADVPCRAFPRLGTSLPFSNGREEQFRGCFYFSSTDLPTASARRNQGCNPHRATAPPALICICYLSAPGKDCKAAQNSIPQHFYPPQCLSQASE